MFILSTVQQVLNIFGQIFVCSMFCYIWLNACMCTHSFITASLCHFMLVCKHQLSNIKKAFKFGHKKNILQVQRARVGKHVILNFGWKKCVCFIFVLSNIYLFIWLLFLSLWRLLLPKYNFVNVHISVSENYTISATYVRYFSFILYKVFVF